MSEISEALELLASLEEIGGNKAGAFTLRSVGAVGTVFQAKLETVRLAMTEARSPDAQREEIEAMRVRMAALVHRGDFRMGGGSTDGKTWGGEKIMVARNPDGYAAMELIDRLAAMPVRDDRSVRKVLMDAKEAIERADNTSGYCCCGSIVESHGFGDGHSPVDQGDYDAQHTLERIDVALAAMPVRDDVERKVVAYLKQCIGLAANVDDNGVQSVFNQGVVRGLEIAHAQIENGHHNAVRPGCMTCGEAITDPSPEASECVKCAALHTPADEGRG